VSGWCSHSSNTRFPAVPYLTLIVLSFCRALEIELNSAKKGPILKPSEAFNMTQVRLSVQVTTAALESALDASNKRASTLLKKFPDSANSLDSAPPRRPDDGAEVSDALERAFSLLHQ